MKSRWAHRVHVCVRAGGKNSSSMAPVRTVNTSRPRLPQIDLLEKKNPKETYNNNKKDKRNELERMSKDDFMHNRKGKPVTAGT